MRFLTCIQNLFEMKNFSGVYAIVKALSWRPVARLEKTFASLSKYAFDYMELHSYFFKRNQKKALAAAQQLIAGNFDLLWNFQNRALCPSVPLIQMVQYSLKKSENQCCIQYLEAFVRIEESRTPLDQGAIDHGKLHKQAELLLEIRRYQFEPYSWISIPQIMVCSNTHVMQA